MMRRTLGEKIEIDVVAGSDVWMVSVDRNQLENAILNLAVNARDAMPDGGRLTIAATNVDPDEAGCHRRLEISGPHVLLSVTDTGSGMPQDVVEKAFDPFFTTKDIGKGTGLGLSQVYGFVTQSGGHVDIDSAPGKGTTVKIYLPRLPQSDAIVVPPSSRSTQPVLATSGATILVVEDEAVVRTFSTEALRDLGFDVLEASDGAAALGIVKTHPEVQLLFADVGLPGGMNGRQLADEAVRHRPGLKVLLTTGYTQNAVVHNGRLDSGVNLLVKPFTYETLAAKMKEILET